jgi:hypothetical protein
MQEHSFAHTFHAKIKQGRLQKGGASIANLKKEQLFAWSSGMAMVLIASPSRPSLQWVGQGC